MEELYKKLREINTEYQQKLNESRDALMQLRIQANKLVKDSDLSNKLVQLEKDMPVSKLIDELEELIKHEYIRKLRNSK